MKSDRISLKSDQINLVDMLLAAEKIETYIDGVTEADFVLNRQLISACAFELMALGEASKDVTERTRRSMRGIDWVDLRLVRNMVAHEHNVLNPRTLWRTLVREVPPIAAALRAWLNDGQSAKG